MCCYVVLQVVRFQCIAASMLWNLKSIVLCCVASVVEFQCVAAYMESEECVVVLCYR